MSFYPFLAECSGHHPGGERAQRVSEVSLCAVVSEYVCGIYSAYLWPFLLFSSVLDVNASDLPHDIKASLKSLAHDLAGALVYDYGEYCALH